MKEPAKTKINSETKIVVKKANVETIRIDGHDLFTLFTAAIIKKKATFVR